MDGEVAQSIAEGTSSYTLSYYPTNSLYNGRFRKISVTLSRPTLSARTRDGYFATSEPPQPDEDQLIDQIETALANPLLYQGIPVKAQTAILPGDPQRLQIVLTGDRRMLTWSTASNGDQQCQLIVAAASYSPISSQKPLRVQREDFAYVLRAAENSSPSQRPVVYTMTLPMESKIERVRVLLRDRVSGQTGTVDLRGPFSAKP